MVDGALVHVRQHGVGAAEREHRRLREEPAHLREGTFPTICGDQCTHRRHPQGEAAQRIGCDPGEPVDRMCRRRRVVVDERGAIAFLRGAVSAAHREHFRREAPAQRTDEAGADHDQREGQGEGVDRNECGHADRPQRRMLQGALADAPGGSKHDGDHRGFDAIEEPRHGRYAAVGHVDVRKADQDEKRWQHEKPARHDAPPGAVHQPADVGRQLLRFGAGQHHAVVERMEETPFRDPAPPLDQLGVHHRDLPGRPAEGEEPELQPEPEGFAKRHRCGLRQVGRFVHL